MLRIKKTNFFSNMILAGKPTAKAQVMGGPLARNISGDISFYPASNGTLVVAEIYNLPKMMPGTPNSPPVGPYGFHIHEGGTCETGNPADPFQGAKGHYNPTNQRHPMHTGDMPVLFANDNGYAFLTFFTDKFTPQQVLNRTIIIHQNPDDFRSQPAGNAGKRLACGLIRAV